MSARFVILLVIAILALVLGFLFGGKQDRDAATEGSTAARATDGSSTARGAADSLAPDHAPTKVSERRPRQKPSHEDTIELSQRTILPSVKLPAQSLAERMVALNALMGKHALSEPPLRVWIDPRTTGRGVPQQESDRLELEPLELRDVSILAAVMHVRDTSKGPILYDIEEGGFRITTLPLIVEDRGYTR